MSRNAYWYPPNEILVYDTDDIGIAYRRYWYSLMAILVSHMAHIYIDYIT